MGGCHSWWLMEDDGTFCRFLQHLWAGWELSLFKSPDHCHGCDTGVKRRTGSDAASSLFQLRCKQRRATFCFLETQRKKYFLRRAAAQRQPVMEISENWVFPLPPPLQRQRLGRWWWCFAGLVLGFFWELGIQILTLILHFRGVSDIKSAHPKISLSLGYLNFSELFPQAELKTWGCSACNKELLSPQPSPVVGVK